ncbi:MAG: hypothetical protein JXR25_15370 [Pontiellaceae bacterium]|nr:hypothetical protein [Pontiellaceae bacterium]MBN2786200.1 hypothetical protein [Pontiellaceae bacterium]
MSKSKKKEFMEQAGQKRGNILREFLDFLRHNKKWWLLPILLILLLMGLILLLSGTALAPFLYPLF